MDKRALIVCFLAGFIVGTLVGQFYLARQHRPITGDRPCLTPSS